MKAFSQFMFNYISEIISVILIVIIVVIVTKYIKLKRNLVETEKMYKDTLESKNRMLKIKESFIHINQSMINFKNIDDCLNMVLEHALLTIPGGRHGSILKLNEDNVLEAVAYKNYDPDKIKKFRLPLEETFIWKATNGNINNTEIISDTSKLNGVVIDSVKTDREWKIRSSISTPLMLDNKLYGFLNIDSSTTNSFSTDDLEIMEYIKAQVERAIYNQGLYKEKIRLSRYDKLTELYNRSYFEELYNRYCNNKPNSQESFYMVIFDVNELKYVNDTYGHLAGDEYIKAFAKKLRETVKGKDMVARYGGDEFIGIYFDKSKEELKAIFNNINEDIKNKSIKVANIYCSFSYGIAKYPENGTEYIKLVNVADKRMYENKRECKAET